MGKVIKGDNMIKVLTAYTYELDNPEKAVQDILDQINLQNSLLKNTVALLLCHVKFIEMGIMERVCKSLPFEVIGCTSMYFGIPDREGEIMLTVTVLTSDDIEFATGVCEPLTAENAEDCIRALYQKTAASFGGGPPNLIFTFPPTMLSVTVDVMTAALDHASGGLPVFGSVALDIDVHNRNPKTIYQGKSYDDRMTLLLFKGPIRPRFFSMCFPKESSMGQNVVITSANGPELISINNKSAVSFFHEIGFLQKNDSRFSQAIPLVIEDRNGNMDVVVVQSITPEGTFICGKHISAGGILNIGVITAEHVLESARTLIRTIKRTIKESGSGAGLFIGSCFSRTVVLGEGAAAEIALIRQELGGFPGAYLYFNSGGEVCPNYSKSGETVNQAFQYAIIACLL
jgi:hypothetical protein